jgi:hypothetical protein
MGTKSTQRCLTTYPHSIAPVQGRLTGLNPRPVVRIVFALASNESGIQFPAVDKSPNEFTAFDIWYAGLSCFPVVDQDDLASYQVLLERSLQPHDAFDLGELAKDEFLDEETRQDRGLRRRRIAALTMDRDGHRQLHL